MTNFEGCQLPCVPKFSMGIVESDQQTLVRRLKRALAVPWNYYVKRWLKQAYHFSLQVSANPEKQTAATQKSAAPVQTGDWVRVRSREEIQSTLDPFKELKGCAFLEEMYQYCNTEQRVLKAMTRFLDERDYKVKKVRGVILLENVICRGTPAFGPCDRCCFLFWREEWLEKIDAPVQA